MMENTIRQLNKGQIALKHTNGLDWNPIDATNVHRRRKYSRTLIPLELWERPLKIRFGRGVKFFNSWGREAISFFNCRKNMNVIFCNWLRFHSPKLYTYIRVCTYIRIYTYIRVVADSSSESEGITAISNSVI